MTRAYPSARAVVLALALPALFSIASASAQTPSPQRARVSRSARVAMRDTAAAKAAPVSRHALLPRTATMLQRQPAGKGRAPMCPVQRDTRARVAASASPWAALSPSAASYTDLPANEILVNGLLAKVKPADDDGTALALPSGDICVIGHQEFRLHALVSSDGGHTFGSDVTIAGGSNQKRVVAFSAAATTVAGQRQVYAAFSVIDPAGDFGLQFASSTDGGRTWSAPRDLVKSGDPSHGITRPVIAWGRDNAGHDILAVAYVGAAESYPFAIVSRDGGTTWGVPVTLETNSAASWSAPSAYDVAVDRKTGAVYVAYAQDRNPVDDSGSHVFLARSLAGATFDTETDISAGPTSGVASDPSIAISYATGSTSVLVTYVDVDFDFGSYTLHVKRSTNAGQGFDDALSESILSAAFMPPRLFPEPSGNTVLLLFGENDGVDSAGTLEIFRSGDNGAGWTVPVDEQTGLFFGLATRTYPAARAVKLPGGTWQVGWTDDYDENPNQSAFFGTLTEVYAVGSSDDGVTWSVAQPISNGTSTTTALGTQGLVGLAPAGTGTAFYLYADQHDSNGTSYRLWGNLASGDPPLVADGAEMRIGPDPSASVDAANFDAPTITVDSNGTLYVAMAVVTNGLFADVHVARSDDGGYSFRTPVKVGDTDPATWNDLEPTLAATADGHVYLAYQSDDGTPYGDGGPVNARTVRFNHSNDFGATWEATDIELDRIERLAPPFYLPDYPHVQLATAPGGKVFVLWSDGDAIKLARSADAGATFAQAEVAHRGQDKDDLVLDGRLCAFGNVVTVAYVDSPYAARSTIFARVSTDGGQTFAPRVDLRPGLGALPGIYYYPLALACDAGTGRAVLYWTDLTSDALNTDVRAARFDGTAWTTTPVVVPSAAGVDAFSPYATFTTRGTGKVAVTYQDGNGAVWIVRSADGGATFAPAQRMDMTDFLSTGAQIASDGAGNVWTWWLDYETSYFGSILSRHASADGATVDANVYRLDRSSPAGALPLSYDVFPVGVADAGTLYTVFSAWRGARHYETAFQAFDATDLGRTHRWPAGDANRSGRSDGIDLSMLGRAFGLRCSDAGYDSRIDLDKNCTIDGQDLAILAGGFGQSR